MKHKWISSLRYKQIFVLIFGAVISFGMYFAALAFGDYLVSRNHMNEDAAWKRLTNYQNSFENYINKYHVSVKNVRSISKWVKNHKYVYVTIFNGDEIIYESGFWNDAYTSYEPPVPLRKTSGRPRGISDSATAFILYPSSILRK
uniref:hypothetical protein n=1 Tax=Clostridium sp. NkU-1 TaxID=1095009 RepID=UPI0006CFDABB